MKARALFAALALVGCPSPPASVAPKSGDQAPAPDPDLAACAQLCAKEQTCGHADLASCKTACENDAARMKRGFVARYVRCYLVDLERACPAASTDAGALTDAQRDALHGRCFDEALAGIVRDGLNQEDMALAVCDRSLRCKLLDQLGRDACLQATLDPKEPEVKLGQHLVDGLRRERVVAFRRCVDQAPCPEVDTHDDAVDACYQRTIVAP